MIILTKIALSNKEIKGLFFKLNLIIINSIVPQAELWAIKAERFENRLGELKNYNFLYFV